MVDRSWYIYSYHGFFNQLITDRSTPKLSFLMGFSLMNQLFLGFTGVGKCPNWTSPNYWRYNFQQMWDGDVQNPQKGTFTNPCYIHPPYSNWRFPKMGGTPESFIYRWRNSRNKSSIQLEMGTPISGTPPIRAMLIIHFNTIFYHKPFIFWYPHETPIESYTSTIFPLSTMSFHYD